MSHQPFNINLNIDTPVADPTAPNAETSGHVLFLSRQVGLDDEPVKHLLTLYARHFGSSGGPRRGFKSEGMLRNAHVTMALALINNGSLFHIPPEMPLHEMGEDGEEARERWLQGPLHRRYVTEVTRTNPRYANATDMKKMDVVICHKFTGVTGLIVEFKLLNPPRSREPQAFQAVWRECFYQVAWYLAGANYMVGTRLAVAVVNSSFQRLHFNGRTLSIEVHEQATVDQLAAISSISMLEESDIWDLGMPHDFFDSETSTFREREFCIYRETYAQGAILAATMTAGLSNHAGPQWDRPTTATGLSAATAAFGYDDQLTAADLKVNKWKRPSENARRPPSNAQNRQPKGPRGGGAGGSGPSHATKTQPRRSQRQAAMAVKNSNSGTHTKSTRPKRKKNRALSIIFPWRWSWFRRDDHDHDRPPATTIVPQLLHGYKIMLVSPIEMDKLIKADVALFTKQRTPTARLQPIAHHPWTGACHPPAHGPHSQVVPLKTGRVY